MLPLVQRLSAMRVLPTQCHQHFPHSRLLTLSSLKHTETTSDPGDTFGRLAVKHQQRNRRHKDSNTNNETPTQLSKDLPRPQEDTLNPRRDVVFSQDKLLKKWQQFKGAQDQEDQETVDSWSDSQQDDAEEDYHLFLKGLSKSQRQKSPNKIPKRKKSHEKVTGPLPDTVGSAGPPQESSEREVFGSLNPTIEMPEGDEGDKREERYQEAKLARKHRPQFYGMRMKALCQERKLAEAIKILEEEMPSVGAKPNDFCYQVLINACGRAGYTKKAFQLYNQMKQHGLNIEPVAYTGLFNACAHSPWPTTDGLQRATNLRAELKKKGYHFNQTISHVMIKAFGRCGDMGTAFLVVDEMIQEGLLVTTETMNFLLQACITNKEAGFRHAIKVWRKMREIKLQPDIYSYNLLAYVIKDCGAGDPSLTSSLLEAEAKKHKPGIKQSDRKKQLANPETLVVKETSLARQSHSESPEGAVVLSRESTSLEGQENTAGQCVLPDILGRKMKVGSVVALGALDKPQDRLALLGGPAGILKQMAKDKVKPNLKTFTQLLDSLPPDTQAEEALLESMTNLGLQPDTQFCNMLIRKRNLRHDKKAAEEVITLMQHHHLIPDLITYGCLALGCCTTHSATQLLKDMDASNIRPNLEIMSSLVGNSVARQDYAFTIAMMREMEQRGTTPDDNLLNLLEKARARARHSQLVKHESSAKDKERRKGSEEAFLMAYKEWLRMSQVQLPEHPWAQYR